MSNIQRIAHQQQNLPPGMINTVQNQQNFDSELTKSLDLVINMKENIHAILKNVAKSKRCQNEANNMNDSVSYDNLEVPANADDAQQLFYKETDSKYLQEKATELNTKLRSVVGNDNSKYV